MTDDPRIYQPASQPERILEDAYRASRSKIGSGWSRYEIEFGKLIVEMDKRIQSTVTEDPMFCKSDGHDFACKRCGKPFRKPSSRHPRRDRNTP